MLCVQSGLNPALCAKCIVAVICKIKFRIRFICVSIKYVEEFTAEILTQAVALSCVLEQLAFGVNQLQLLTVQFPQPFAFSVSLTMNLSMLFLYFGQYFIRTHFVNFILISTLQIAKLLCINFYGTILCRGAAALIRWMYSAQQLLIVGVHFVQTEAHLSWDSPLRKGRLHDHHTQLLHIIPPDACPAQLFAC